jgi:hypothetical protein
VRALPSIFRWQEDDVVGEVEPDLIGRKIRERDALRVFHADAISLKVKQEFAAKEKAKLASKPAAKAAPAKSEKRLEVRILFGVCLEYKLQETRNRINDGPKKRGSLARKTAKEPLSPVCASLLA